MIDQVASAFKRKDYKTAAQLLKQWQQQSPDNPWIQFYRGQLQEVAGKTDMAEAIYRQLLRDVSNQKLVAQVREGLQRLETIAQAKRQQAIDAVMTDPAKAGLGFLFLEPIPPETRTTAAQNFARIMKLDAYTARLILPSRGWKLYRTGTLGEMQVYVQELQAAGVPAFWVALTTVQKLRVFRVQHFQAASPQVTVVCQDESNQLGALSFNWSEIANRVEGLLPIFEQVVDVGAFNQLKRKEQTQDFAQVLDLHLPKRKCLLRLCDRTYQFDQGVVFNARQDGAIPITQTTTRIRWNRLLQFLDRHLAQVPIYADFSTFADTAIEQLDLVKGIEAHIDLLRRAPTQWDPAFHLYSGTVFEYTQSNPTK